MLSFAPAKSLAFDPTKAPRSELALAERRLADFKAEEAALRAIATDTSFDALCNHDVKLQGVRRHIVIAEQAVEFKRIELDKAERAAAEKAADAAHRAAEKAAANDAKLVLEVAAAAEKLAEKLAELEESRKRTDASNSSRGDRAIIVDAETRVRGTPSRTIPATFEDRMQWVDDEGRTPSELRMNAAGQLVPSDHGNYTYRRMRVRTSAEHFEPAKMPRRLADEIRLVDLSGRVIWPPR